MQSNPFHVKTRRQAFLSSSFAINPGKIAVVIPGKIVSKIAS